MNNQLQFANEDITVDSAQTPENETSSAEGRAEGLDEGRSGLGAGGSVAHQLTELGSIDDNLRQTAKCNDMTTGSSLPLDELGGPKWLTVPVMEASILHEHFKTQLARTEILVFREDDNVDAQPSSDLHVHRTDEAPLPGCHYQLPETEDFKLPEVASEDSVPILQLQEHCQAAVPGASSYPRVRFKGVRELANLQGAVKKRGRPPGSRRKEPAKPNAGPLLKQVIGKPDYKTLGQFLLGQDCSIANMEDSDTRPPHPYDVGKVYKVNICPVCEQYTATELDRPADADPESEALRARFECSLCGEWFDIGMTLFDPRGTPGVTLYQGEDKFRPPVPPRSTYPCTGCRMKTDTSFKCMVLYLRDETSVKCEPQCPAHRLNANSSSKKNQEMEKKL